MKKSDKYLKTENQQEPARRYTIFNFDDGYRVYDPQTGKSIHQGAFTLKEAEQFCQNNQIGYIVAEQDGKALGELVNAPQYPKELTPITPFELAHVACQISFFHHMRLIASGEKGRDQEPRCYLQQAHALILEAAAHLESVKKEQTTYTFDQILRGMPTGQSQQEADAKTMLSGITSRDGLIKAIHREFAFPDDELIISRGSLTQWEFEDLRSRLNKRRSRNARISRQANSEGTAKKPKRRSPKI